MESLCSYLLGSVLGSDIRDSRFLDLSFLCSRFPYNRFPCSCFLDSRFLDIRSLCSCLDRGRQIKESMEGYRSLPVGKLLVWRMW